MEKVAREASEKKTKTKGNWVNLRDKEEASERKTKQPRTDAGQTKGLKLKQIITTDL